MDRRKSYARRLIDVGRCKPRHRGARVRPFLSRANILVVRFEDLVSDPEPVMKAVYSHLGLSYSNRFLQPFTRAFPRRFLWTTAIDWSTGIKKDFDASRIDEWKQQITAEQLRFVIESSGMLEFMLQFRYI